MKKTSILLKIFTALILFIGVTIFYIQENHSEYKKNMIQSELSVKTGEMMESSMKDIDMKDAIVSAGLYEVYSVDKLTKAKDSKVVLFFNAKWCPTCIEVDKELKSNEIPNGLTILSVDYDSYNDLKKKYKVTYQHTFVEVNAEGIMINKWSGGGLINIKKQVNIK